MLQLQVIHFASAFAATPDCRCWSPNQHLPFKMRQKSKIINIILVKFRTAKFIFAGIGGQHPMELKDYYESVGAFVKKRVCYISQRLGYFFPIPDIFCL
jgi:hypothetical protein